MLTVWWWRQKNDSISNWQKKGYVHLAVAVKSRQSLQNVYKHLNTLFSATVNFLYQVILFIAFFLPYLSLVFGHLTTLSKNFSVLKFGLNIYSYCMHTHVFFCHLLKETIFATPYLLPFAWKAFQNVISLSAGLFLGIADSFLKQFILVNMGDKTEIYRVTFLRNIPIHFNHPKSRAQ